METDTRRSVSDSAGRNDFATTPIPIHMRRSLIDVTLVVCAFCICMSGLFTGAAMSAGLRFWDCVVAAVIGNSILALYGGLIGAAGAKHGVSTSMLMRHAFGLYGAKIVAAVLAITILGWYSVQTWFFGQSIHALWPGGGVLTSVWVAALWGGLLMIITPYLGYRGLSVLSKVAVPLLIVLSFWGLLEAFGSGNILHYTPSEEFSLGKGVTLAVGSFAVGAVLQADIMRYARSVRAAWIASALGYVLANTYIIIAGATTAMATGEGNLPAAMLAIGLGAPAIIVLIVAQWTTNDNNLYSGSLSLATILRAEKRKIVLVTGILATLVGAAGLARHFVPWLVGLGIALPPIAGVLLIDCWVCRSHAYRYDDNAQWADWNWFAFPAWIIGMIVGATATFGIPSVNSIVASMTVYWLLMKGFASDVDIPSSE